MTTATIFEAKTNLSKLIQRALAGEEVQITIGRDRKPVARLVPIQPVSGSRRLGFLQGQVEVGPEFFDPLPEDELRLWNGEGE
jgi:antitoxin (DNA-binding transcriptional repressor) of toxin-antitoxin stability system